MRTVAQPPVSTRFFPGVLAAILAVAPACSSSTGGSSSTPGSSGGAGGGAASSSATADRGGSSAASSTSGSSAGTSVSAGATGGQSTGTGGTASPSGGTTNNTNSRTGGAGSTGGTSTGSPGGINTGGTSKATGGNGTVGGSTGGTGGNGGTTSSKTDSTPKGGTPAVTGHYQMENLDRGVVAVKVSGGMYVGWRMFGYEYNPTSPTSVSYNLYRDGAKVASVTDSTNYLDASGDTTSVYTVTVVENGSEGAPSPQAKVLAQNYIKIALSQPGTDYEANDASPGDLDGDGQYELVLKWQPANAQDNSKAGVTSNTYLDGLKLDGKRLWRIDLGPNIRSGAHYTQHVVYDFDGDGKAEVAVKTAPGTKDGKGAYLHTGPAANDDDSKKYANSDGYILSGPEYLTVFSGATGEELATVEYPILRGTSLKATWGDDYGNRVDRFNAGAGFVKDGGGKTASGLPSIIEQRGYYTRLTASAYTFRAGKLEKNWVFDSDSGNSKAAGQGNHSAMVADVDGDGAQEFITGSTTINSDGTLRCVTGLGHGDALHVSEFIPGKGISVFMPHEEDGGYDLHNAATCAMIAKAVGTDDNGRGVADDISPSNPGAEFWTAAYDQLFSASTGASVGSKPKATNFLIYWDADESRELLDGATISKLGSTSNLLSVSECNGNNGTKNTPTLTADLFGDWREELVVRETNNQALRVYTTTDVTKRRLYTLMHDPTYRMQVTFEQSSYNQPPHPGFHIGSGMKDPPKPDIFVK
jgi:rhamnogalacturonan endolyase